MSNFCRLVVKKSSTLINVSEGNCVPFSMRKKTSDTPSPSLSTLQKESTMRDPTQKLWIAKRNKAIERLVKT